MNTPVAEVTKGWVHCPSCTHTVPAKVYIVAKRMRVLAGQQCERCYSSLDAAAVLYLAHAA
jgi:hypothetical protein